MINKEIKTHELKTWPNYYADILLGQKRFELRKNDRDFQLFDRLKLMEYNPEKEELTGRWCAVRIDYILHGGKFGLEEGYVILGISMVLETE